MIRSSHRRGIAVAASHASDITGAFAAAALDGGGMVCARQALTVALLEVADWRPWLPEAQALLSPEEAMRSQRRRNPGERDALVLAYALHRLLLATVLDRDPCDVPLYRDERGCPRLHGVAAHTSLSHADGMVAVAVTTSGPVGVDIEPRMRAAVMPEIARSVCHGSEAAAIRALAEPARAAAMLALWVRKEALLKAAGIGLAVPMESFCAPEHHALVLPWLSVEAVQVRMLDAGNDFVAAVVGSAGAVVDCRWLRPATAPADTGIFRPCRDATAAIPP